METVMLGNQGQLVLPKVIRDSYQWREGSKFFLWDMGGGIMIKPVSPFPASQLEPPDTLQPISPFPVSQLEPLDTPSVYQGTPLSIEDMEKAIDIEAGKHK